MKNAQAPLGSPAECLTLSLSLSRHLRQLNLRSVCLALLLGLSVALASPASGALLLDDDWDDGDRTDTNLPEESAWYANNTGIPGIPTLSAGAGSLTGNVRMFETNTSSRLWITHYTPAGSPVELGLKDVLKITLVFTPSNVTTLSASTRGLRIGLFNFSEPGAARVSGDGFSTGAGAGAPGANVTGYILNMNFAQILTNSPLEIMKRTDTTNINLMGASGVFTRLGIGGGPAGAPGFSNGMSYTLEFSIKRNPNSVEITTTFSDTNGWSITQTATDPSNPTFRFDGFAMRPNSVADAADAFVFTRFKAETFPFTPRISSILLSAFDAQITWETLPDRMYQLQARASWGTGDSWMLLHEVTAAGDSESFTDRDFTSREQRFYRVLQLP